MNNPAYLITVVVPVFNGGRYIEPFLVQLSQQTFQDFEVLFLDSCSTDGTTELIKSAEKKDGQIKLILEKDKGIYDAMNRGVASANGEWVYFMGCDDGFIDAFVLEKLSFSLTKEYDLVYGDVLWVPDDVLEKGVCTPANLINRNINHQRIFYRRELFQNFGGYDLQYEVASDHELNIRFFCNDAIRKNYFPLTIARYHSGGFSANKLDEVFWSNWKSIFRKNFSRHLPAKVMYEKLGWYSRWLIDQQQYAKAWLVFFDVLLHTFSPGFVLLSFRQLIQSFRKNAS